MSIKLIASDMDGTLLSSDIAISETNKAAIRQAVEQGLVFLIATGRMYVSAQPYAADLGLDVPLVTYNGALVEGSLSGKVYSHTPIPLDVALEALTYCKEKGYHIQAYVNEELLVREADSLSEEYRRLSNVPPHPVGDALYHLTAAPTKMLVMTPSDRFHAIFQDLTEHFRGRLTVVSSKENFIDLIAPGVNKWNGVKAVASLYGIQPEEIMCIGDSGNDVGMIRNAGLGVAVDNANDAARQAAKVVVPSNDDDGVARAIELALTRQVAVPE
ncbi:MAG: Cof-type HAD-IIB family hydrolase [Succiniclasticum sp.]|jgi:Cof subfamily protein (haloacid dehalogenase superfamily)